MRKHGRGKINSNENDGRQVIMKHMGRKEFRPIFFVPKNDTASLCSAPLFLGEWSWLFGSYR